MAAFGAEKLQGGQDEISRKDVCDSEAPGASLVAVTQVIGTQKNGWSFDYNK